MDHPNANPNESTTPSSSNIREPVSESAIAYVLKEAAAQGRLREIRWLKPEQLLFAANDESWTPLHVAAKYGQLEQIAPMLTLESMMTSDAQFGITPLRILEESGHLEQLDALFPPEVVADVKRLLNQGLL
jgi:hypothetical protein